MLTATPSTPVIPPVFHALTFVSRLPEEDVERIASDRSENVSWGTWYKSRNRNGELVFTNNRILAFLWPSSNLYRAQLKGDLTEQEARKEAAITFLAAGIPEDRAKELSEALEFDSEHRVYKVGKVSPFEIRDYKESLGLRFYADKSHPGTIEMESTTPSWARSMINVLQIFSREIQQHLEVLRQISDAFSSDDEARRKVQAIQEANAAKIEQLTFSIEKLVTILYRESTLKSLLKRVYRKVLMRKVPNK